MKNIFKKSKPSPLTEIETVVLGCASFILGQLFTLILLVLPIV